MTRTPSYARSLERNALVKDPLRLLLLWSLVACGLSDAEICQRAGLSQGELASLRQAYSTQLDSLRDLCGSALMLDPRSLGHLLIARVTEMALSCRDAGDMAKLLQTLGKLPDWLRNPELAEQERLTRMAELAARSAEAQARLAEAQLRLHSAETALASAKATAQAIPAAYPAPPSLSAGGPAAKGSAANGHSGNGHAAGLDEVQNAVSIPVLTPQIKSEG
jgi:hypothetical protein